MEQKNPKCPAESPAEELSRIVTERLSRNAPEGGEGGWQSSSPHELDPLTNELDRLAEELAEPLALAHLAADPYWPKWDGPWWKLLLLFELDRFDLAPRATLEALARSAEKHYLDFFPRTEEELPKGIDPYRNIVCHCALGSLYRMLASGGLDVDGRFPWMRLWFSRYQLPDGGLNCDDEAYRKHRPHSSFLSTLPCLEALLFTRDASELEEEDRDVLAQGATYLLDRRLCRSRSKGMKLVDEDWLRPAFPRYYFYDVLRALHFLVAWARSTKTALPAEALLESVESLSKATDGKGQLRNRPRKLETQGSLRQGGDGSWTWLAEASPFPLLRRLAEDDGPSAPLSRQWHAVLTGLQELGERGLLT